jgi:hypothetical protein
MPFFGCGAHRLPLAPVMPIEHREIIYQAAYQTMIMHKSKHISFWFNLVSLSITITFGLKIRSQANIITYKACNIYISPMICVFGGKETYKTRFFL